MGGEHRILAAPLISDAGDDEIGLWIVKDGENVIFQRFINDCALTPYFIGIGVIFLFFFALWEHHVAAIEETPLVSLKLFTNKQFTLGASITTLLSLSQAGVSFIIPVFLQSVLNLSPLQTGYAMLPMSLTLLVAAPVTTSSANSLRRSASFSLGSFSTVSAFGYLRSVCIQIPANGRSRPALHFLASGLAS